MPKSSSVPGLDRLRELFTSAERAVLEATAGSALLAASQQQLAKTLVQVRAFRDKWRDLHATQTRATKRSAGGGAAANARSREKAGMFTAAIERIQSRLAEVGLAPAATRGAMKTTRPTARAARKAGHRTARAGVKGALTAAAAEINRGRTGRVVAAPRPAAAAPASSTPVRAPAGAAGAAKPKAGKKRRPAAKAAAVLAKGGGQPLRIDVKQQRSAKASATVARLKFDGQVNRRAGHALAAGKRRQAARDRRSR